MQVIPALDVLGDDAVRLDQGQYDKVLFRRPLETSISKILKTQPSFLHVVDLDGARSGAVRVDLVEKCIRRAAPLPLQFSGGIRSLEDARSVLDAGATRVILSSALWKNGAEALETYTEGLGPSLVAAIDVKDGHLSLRGWTEESSLTLEVALERCVNYGVPRLHVTAIRRDGTMSGPDLDLYRTACSYGIPVIAAGGIRDEGDLLDLENIGCEAAVMGLGYLNLVKASESGVQD